MSRALQVVWFKRDLRITDHAPLAAAAAAGPVLPLYVVEPGYWRGADVSARQYAFVRESLLALRESLAALGQPLVVRIGDVVEVLARIARFRGIAAVHSHQETGNDWTHARDRRVAAWLRAAGIPWHEHRQTGVVRGLRRRSGWSAQWLALMRAPLVPSPIALEPLAGVEPGTIPEVRDVTGDDDACPERQRGGRPAALALLESFVATRAHAYLRGMSSPVAAAAACSRLSPHFAAGTLSLREAASAARRVLDGAADDSRRRALAAFASRLRWHCHFIQKLESEPALEFEPMHRGYDGLHAAEPDAARLAAWCRGETGWPFVDACQRMLAATGWINFRMRAMLMAVASYHLALPWRATGLHLARRFTDYEPGIHWPQCQMQSGVTGINVPRIYNPLKQSRDQDPDGRFIRRWIPALARVPGAWVHAPWRMPSALARAAGLVLGRDYPAPLLDHEQAARAARARLAEWRRRPGMREQELVVLERHGSRRRAPVARRPRPATAQRSLFEAPDSTP